MSTFGQVFANVRTSYASLDALIVHREKSVESFRNHCVIEQKITRKSIEACDFCAVFCSITQ